MHSGCRPRTVKKTPHYVDNSAAGCCEGSRPLRISSSVWVFPVGKMRLIVNLSTRYCRPAWVLTRIAMIRGFSGVGFLLVAEYRKRQLLDKSLWADQTCMLAWIMMRSLGRFGIYLRQMISQRFLVRTSIAERGRIPVIENSDPIIKDSNASKVFTGFKANVMHTNFRDVTKKPSNQLSDPPSYDRYRHRSQSCLLVYFVTLGEVKLPMCGFVTAPIIERWSL